MSDHFIGNTMDSINAFITQNDQQQASKYLILFSRLIRKVLENSTQKLIPLSEDIEVLTAYLELEKLRFNNNFDYSINMADTIDAGNTLVPPMVLQVLAENSIQHGLTKREGGHIAIHIQQQESLILCRVTDNGIGRSITTLATDKSRRSIGSGLAKRLLQATSRSKKAVSYQVTDLLDQNNQPAGTTVAYTLPYIPVE
jgi:sensor histidine kinase YesM